MQFLGGKHRQARTIIEHIVRYSTFQLGRPNIPILIEPFCGACNVTAEAARQGFKVQASDAHPALIAMWQALIDGWQPPSDDMSEVDYQAAKALPDTDPLKALVGFGRSFGGKYFGGYARDNPPKPPQDFWGAAVRGSMRKALLMRDHVQFQCVSYDELGVTNGAVFYCDPPYRGTTSYANSRSFDHNQFWEWCRLQAQRCTVFVTEFDVPDDATVIHEFARKTQLDGVSGAAKCVNIEKLVVFDRTR